MASALERSLQRLTLRSSSARLICRQNSTFKGSAPRSQESDSLRNSQNLTNAVLQSVEANAAQKTFSQAPRQSVTGILDGLDNSATPGAGQTSRLDIAGDALRAAVARPSTQANLRTQNLGELARNYTRDDLDRQVTRRWRQGDVYAPHDLSSVEAAKWKKQRKRAKPKWDAIDQLGLDPLMLYKNYSIMSEYTTAMGRIKPASETGLRPRNQRKMAKAIRRAMGIGLIPGTYRHPELMTRGYFPTMQG